MWTVSSKQRCLPCREPSKISPPSISAIFSLLLQSDIYTRVLNPSLIYFIRKLSGFALLYVFVSASFCVGQQKLPTPSSHPMKSVENYGTITHHFNSCDVKIMAALALRIYVLDVKSTEQRILRSFISLKGKHFQWGQTSSFQIYLTPSLDLGGIFFYLHNF